MLSLNRPRLHQVVRFIISSKIYWIAVWAIKITLNRKFNPKDKETPYSNTWKQIQGVRIKILLDIKIFWHWRHISSLIWFNILIQIESFPNFNWLNLIYSQFFIWSLDSLRLFSKWRGWDHFLQVKFIIRLWSTNGQKHC